MDFFILISSLVATIVFFVSKLSIEILNKQKKYESRWMIRWADLGFISGCYLALMAFLWLFVITIEFLP